MDLMLAYFPIVKGIVIFIMVLVLVLLVRKGWYRTSFVLGATMVALAIYSPIKIDGTNTSRSHKTTSAERTAEYIEVADEAGNSPKGK